MSGTASSASKQQQQQQNQRGQHNISLPPHRSSNINNKRKRNRNPQSQPSSSSISSSWKELPKFLDSVTSVSASTFGSRRLPEIQRLYSNTNSTNSNSNPTLPQQQQHHHEAFISGGCKTSSRHLRRRTTSTKIKSSHKRHRYRYPYPYYPTTEPTIKKGVVEEEEGRQQQEKVLLLSAEDNDDKKDEATKSTTRKAIRGRKETLCQNHYGWWKQQQQQQQQQQKDDNNKMMMAEISTTTKEKSNSASCNDGDDEIHIEKEKGSNDDDDAVPSSSNNKTKAITKTTTTTAITRTTTNTTKAKVVVVINWMITHIWHTKRFHIEQLWGWKIPMFHNNRGPRAIFRLLLCNNNNNNKQKCTIQDITWKRGGQSMTIVTSTSTSSSLTNVIQSCLRICPTFGSMKGTICGSIMGDGILYELDQFPFNAIGPVSWMIYSRNRRRLRNSNNNNNEKEWIIQWMVHPSIQSSLQQCLQNLISDSSSMGTTTSTTTTGDGDDINTSISKSIFRLLTKHQEEEEVLLRGVEQQQAPPAMCCFRISGSTATQVLCNTLNIQSLKSSSSSTGDLQQKKKLHEWDWDYLQHIDLRGNENNNNNNNNTTTNNSNSYCCPPHGAIVRVKVEMPSNRNNNNNNKDTPMATNEKAAAATATTTDDDAKKKLNDHIQNVQKAIEELEPENDDNDDGSIKTGNMSSEDNDHEKDDDGTTTTTMILVWRSPRPLDCNANRAVSGWDVYVSPKIAMKIWMAFEMSGSCCSIGIVEESHLYLECNPPIPIFPRDYIDTKQGQLYWDGDCNNNNNNNSWSLVRRLCEGGWGRLPAKKKQDRELMRITWGDLVSLEDDVGDDVNNNTPIAIVRGAFGRPFMDAVAGCGHLLITTTSAPTTRRRRKRRRVRPPNETFLADPLPKEEAKQFGQMCQNLQTSLSLPAVLVCHVRSFGKRKISTGTKLFFNNRSTSSSEQTGTDGEEYYYLGRVTVGEFSLSRGLCHGIAIIGAARLLKALEIANGRAGCIVRQLNDNREVHFAATAQTNTGINFQVSISLIL